MITNAFDQIRWRWDTSPFGELPSSADPSGVGTFAFNLRFPGQYFDAETGLFYNYFRDYDPQTGRYISTDPIGLTGGLNPFLYARANPLRYIDPIGLDVFMCHQPAFGLTYSPVDHYWLKTDTVEAGMGGTRGNVPGNQSGDLPYDRVQVTDHTGRSKEKGASCEPVKDVDEQKVNDLLRIGRPLGRWTPTNQCQSFARGVLNQASTLPPTPMPWFDVPLY